MKEKKRSTALFTVSVLVCLVFEWHAVRAQEAGVQAKQGSGQEVVDLKDAPDFLYEQNLEVARKREKAQALVQQGSDLVATDSLVKVCNKIVHDPALVRGEIFLFMLDLEGVVWAHQDPDLLWKNLYDEQDDFGNYYVRDMIQKALDGEGWFSYRWRNVTKVSYVKIVEKAGKKFVLAAGYYPIFKAQDVVSLVRGAVDLFNSFVKEGLDKEIPFGVYMYPYSRFLSGNLYITVYDSKGIIVSHGDKPSLLGRRAMSATGKDDKPVVQTVIDHLKDRPVGEGFWVQHRSKNAMRNVYAERVQDAQENSYYIVSGFYPGENRERVIDLVSRGYRYLKTYGKTAAKDAFQGYSAKKNMRITNNFVYGNLYLLVMDLKGNVIISGENPDVVGVNFYDFKDEQGQYVFREIIQRAQKEERAWVNFITGNALISVYGEYVEVGLDKLVIACSFYPASKPEMMRLMVESAGSYLKLHSEQEAFSAFSSAEGAYLRGDLQVFSLNTDVRCYVWGDEYRYIWKDMANLKSEDGTYYVKDLVDLSKKRVSQLGVTLNNAYKVYYALPVQKGEKLYIVGSGYYP